MDAKTKAKQLGITVQALHQAVKRDPSFQGAKKVGNRLVFPDSSSITTDDPTEFPPEEESKRKREFWNAEKARQDCLKITRLNQADTGQLVDRKELDDAYRKIFSTLQTKILALPSRLKRAVGDQLPEAVEDALETMVNDLLEEVGSGG